MLAFAIPCLPARQRAWPHYCAICIATWLAAGPVLASPPPTSPTVLTPKTRNISTTQPASGSPSELAAQFDKSPDTVVADVSGTPITLGMVADRLQELSDKFSILPTQTLYRAALVDLIQQRALAVKARELGLDRDPAAQRQIAESTDRTLGQALQRRIVPEMVSDKVIADRYDAIVAGKPGPEEVRFQVIATATEPDARIALNLLSKGTDFSTLAMQVSKDPSAVNGGEIGYARRDRLTPEIGAVVFALVPGQTTAFPVFSNNMWFVIHVEGRRQQGTPTFAEAKADLTSELTREASQEILQKTLAAVVVNDYGPTGARGHEQQAPPTAH